MNETVDFKVSPFVVIWENTRACDLACVHCRSEAQTRRNQSELKTEDGYDLIDQIAELGPRAFVITGGDPLKREDTYDMIRYARSRRLEPALTASATPLLTEAAIARMKHHGLARLAMRLDASHAQAHDDFRRVRGSFDITLRAIRAAKREGIPVQINTTVTRRTIDDLPRMIELLADHEIALWSVFFLVPTGRGSKGDLVSPQAVERLFAFLYEAGKRTPFPIRTTEAMHYRRYVLQRMAIEQGRRIDDLRNPATGLIDTSTLFAHEPGGPAPYGAHEDKGLFISHLGDVYPSGCLPLKAGNVKEQALADIYRTSDLFVSLRDGSNLKGKCGRCEFRELCGGSRARAWSATGDVFESDPLCDYQPRVA
jgi:radical SAM protein